MLIGRRHELFALREAILARQSLLVYGDPGAGKTALLTEVLSDLPPYIRRNCLLCSVHESPCAIWRSLTRSLAQVDDPEVRSRMNREYDCSAATDRWLRRQTSLRLRGILRRAMSENPYCVLFDTACRLPDAVYPLLQEWVWSQRTPVILLARGSSERELGRVARLYWHGAMRLELAAMALLDLEAFLDQSILRWNLGRVADREFRRFVLQQAHGLPGAIAQLCELATQTAYHSSGRLKLHTLAVDFRLYRYTPNSSLERTKNHA